jgi:hypothetical protein
LKKLIKNQDGSIVVGSLLKDDKVRKSVKELMKRLSFGAREKSILNHQHIDSDSNEAMILRGYTYWEVKLSLRSTRW